MARGRKPGTKVSAQVRANISAAQQGHPVSEQTRQKIGAAHRGRPKPDATRQRMSAAQQGHPVSEQTRQKIAATLRDRARLRREQAAAEALAAPVTPPQPLLAPPTTDPTPSPTMPETRSRGPFTPEERSEIVASWQEQQARNRQRLIAGETRLLPERTM